MALGTIMTYGQIFKICAILVLLSLSLTEVVLTTNSQSFFNDARQAMSATNKKILDYLEFKTNRTYIETIDNLVHIIYWKIMLAAISWTIVLIYCLYNSRNNAKAMVRRTLQLTLSIIKICELSVTILMLKYLHISSKYILTQNLDVQSYFNFDHYSIITVIIISTTHIGFGLTLLTIAGIRKMTQVFKTKHSHSQFTNETSFIYTVNDNYVDTIERGGGGVTPLFIEAGDNTDLMLSFMTESSLIDETNESIEIIYETILSIEKSQSEDDIENRTIERDSVVSEEQILAPRVRDSIAIHSTTSRLRLSNRTK